jgi:hypothetical protein
MSCRQCRRRQCRRRQCRRRHYRCRQCRRHQCRRRQCRRRQCRRRHDVVVLTLLLLTRIHYCGDNSVFDDQTLSCLYYDEKHRPF